MAKAPVAHIEKAGEAPSVEESRQAERPQMKVEEVPQAQDQARAAEAPAKEAAPGTTRAASAGKGPLAWLAKVFPGHEHAALGGVGGLLIALLFFVIGFWKTLFVCLLVVVGVALGQYLDGDPKIANLIHELLAEGRGGN